MTNVIRWFFSIVGKNNEWNILILDLMFKKIGSSLVFHCFKALHSGGVVRDLGGNESINYLNSSQPQPFLWLMYQLFSYYQGYAKMEPRITKLHYYIKGINTDKLILFTGNKKEENAIARFPLICYTVRYLQSLILK